MKNSVTRKLSSAKWLAAAVMLLLALAVAFGGRTVTAQAAVKTSYVDMVVGKTISFKTSDYSKVTSSNSKVLKVTKKSGKYVVTAKKAGKYEKYGDEADEYGSVYVSLFLYKKGKLTKKIGVDVYAPSKMICLGKSASYKTSEYSKVKSGSSKILKVTKKNGKYVVTAKKVGMTTLRLYKGEKLVKKLNVVTPKASNLKTDTSAKTLKVGKSFNWKLKADRYVRVKYESSDSSILSVSEEGKCKAKNAGTVTLTMKLTWRATTFKTYKRKVTVKALKTSEKEVVKKTVNVPIATLADGYNKSYVKKKNITMLDTCQIVVYKVGSSVERALIYSINSSSLTHLKITGDAAELVDVTNNTRYVFKEHPTGTSWYNKWDGATEVYIRTNTTGKAVLTAEDATHVYKITLNVMPMSNKADGTPYTGWVGERGCVLNPDKAGANLCPSAIYEGDTNVASWTHLVYKGRFAKTAKEMQAAAKVNCTPIKKFLKSENWDDLDDFEKVKQIREFLFDGENLTYGQNRKLNGWSLVMYGKDGVCSDYSDAVSVLCKLLGLDVVQVAGSSHEWPLVKIRGKWYDADLMKGTTYADAALKGYQLSDIARCTKMQDGLLEYTISAPTTKVYRYGGWNKCISNGGKIYTYK